MGRASRGVRWEGKTDVDGGREDGVANDIACEDGREVGSCDARGGGGSGAAGVGVRLRRVAREVGVPRGGDDVAVER